ncbi:phage-associated protein, BcepMu gp16 family [Lactococcus lactis subsp. lactis]|nr:phage-associated protein, BcepMu gp16 family [Lactococcus lactis subsp. lactis]
MTWSKESREKQSNRFINPFKVIDYRGEVIAIYKNSVEAEREGGFQSNAIRQVLNGRAKTHKGFTFERILVEEFLAFVGEE